MRQRTKTWWVSATICSLAAFSFFAGLGMRGLYERLNGRVSSSVSSIYPRFASAERGVAQEPDLKPRELFLDVLRKLQLYYVEQLPSETQLTYGSLDQMLSSLKDPNTRLVSKTEAEAIEGAMNGRFPGLGAILTIRRYERSDKSAERLITVVSVIPGGPAEKAGLQPGDRITEIDGHWIAPMHVSYRLWTQLTDDLGPQDLQPRQKDDDPELFKLTPDQEKAREENAKARVKWKNASDLTSALRSLSGEEKGEHKLTVERGSPAKTLQLPVTLGETQSPLVTSSKPSADTGYLRILATSAASAKQVGDILAGWSKSGVKNVVIDLRNSPGGDLEAARDIAAMLCGDGKFAVLKQRDAARQLVSDPVVIRGASVRLKPASTAVVVDGGTAGAAELLAAALRDNLGAKLVGTTTFGDGTEQELLRLENGAAVSITRAKMLTSKGEDFDGKGLKADIAPQGDPIDAAVKAVNN